MKIKEISALKPKIPSPLWQNIYGLDGRFMGKSFAQRFLRHRYFLVWAEDKSWQIFERCKWEIQVRTQVLLTATVPNEEEFWPTYLCEAGLAAYCLFKSGLISSKLRHIVNTAPSLRFHREIGQCQMDPEILIDSHSIHFLSVRLCHDHIYRTETIFFSQNRAFERSWWSKFPTSRCTARSCPTRCTRSSPPTSSPSSSSSSLTRTTKCGKPARQRCLSFSSRGWSTRPMWRSRWARSEIDVNASQRSAMRGIWWTIYPTITWLLNSVLKYLLRPARWYNLNGCSSKRTACTVMFAYTAYKLEVFLWHKGRMYVICIQSNCKVGGECSWRSRIVEAAASVSSWSPPGPRSSPDLRPLGPHRYVAHPPVSFCVLTPEKAKQTNKSPHQQVAICLVLLK